MSDKITIKKIKDESTNYHIKIDKAPDLPFKVGIIGKSQLSGKTNLMINLMCQRKIYGKYFKGDNIYLVSPSLETYKLKKFVECKKIPEENLFPEYDDDEVGALFEYLKDEFDNGNTKHKIIILDDCGFSARGSTSSNLDKLIITGRHYNISIMMLVQNYTMMSTNLRRNLTGVFCFSCVMTEMEFICAEHNTCALNKKDFMRAFINATKKKHNFLLIDYSKEVDDGRYRINLDESIIIE
jgi:hypothetical protein